MAQSCKGCLHLLVPPTPSGRRMVREGHVYRCNAPIDKAAINALLPESMYRLRKEIRQIETGAFVGGIDGATCSLWSAL